MNTSALSAPGFRLRLRTRIDRSARWVSRRANVETTFVMTGSAPRIRHERYSTVRSQKTGVVDLAQDVIWLDHDAEEERLFNEKLKAFLELEVGNTPERRWLLKGSNLVD